jgi:hypothetical protein
LIRRRVSSAFFFLKPQMAQYLTDLRNGKTLHTYHIATGGHQSFQWEEHTQTMFVNTWNDSQVGVTTECENWTIGTLQIPFRKRHEAFKTNY